MPVIPATLEAEEQGSEIWGQLGQTEILSQKNFFFLNAGGTAQVVEYLPSKHKALGSIPSTVGKKEEEIA
jgi:hypothetical protein